MGGPILPLIPEVSSCTALVTDSCWMDEMASKFSAQATLLLHSGSACDPRLGPSVTLPGLVGLSVSLVLTGCRERGLQPPMVQPSSWKGLVRLA